MSTRHWVGCAIAVAVISMLACGTPDGSLDNDEECSGSEQCKSGYCERRGGQSVSYCKTRCIPSGNACGPSIQAVSACCSGFCGSTGTCR